MGPLSPVEHPHRPTFAQRLSDRFSSVSRKRPRDREEDEENREVPSSPKFRTPEKRKKRAKCCSLTPSCRRNYQVHLQNIDFVEDAVVVTALDHVPFCCHKDLLSMDREELIIAAQSLNEKLPAVLRIDVSDTQTDVFILNSIELVVGIRTARPPSSMVQSSSFPSDSSHASIQGTLLPPHSDSSYSRLPLTPTHTRSYVGPSEFGSPASRRSRYSDRYSSPLAVLSEEEGETDGDEDEANRPLKRRRTRLTRLNSMAQPPMTPSPLHTRQIQQPHTTTPVRPLHPKSKMSECFTPLTSLLPAFTAATLVHMASPLSFGSRSESADRLLLGDGTESVDSAHTSDHSMDLSF